MTGSNPKYPVWKTQSNSKTGKVRLKRRTLPLLPHIRYCPRMLQTEFCVEGPRNYMPTPLILTVKYLPCPDRCKQCIK
ncbi:hypothetical protein M8J76_014751 [Diaphorina citri]|nr:hypothetical protein M8J75_005756 [Diaphorina citri]KAI5716931.1 hypothetical protein M8J76_014751 [Diaphorina citri]